VVKTNWSLCDLLYRLYSRVPQPPAASWQWQCVHCVQPHWVARSHCCSLDWCRRQLLSVVALTPLYHLNKLYTTQCIQPECYINEYIRHLQVKWLKWHHIVPDLSNLSWLCAQSTLARHLGGCNRLHRSTASTRYNWDHQRPIQQQEACWLP